MFFQVRRSFWKKENKTIGSENVFLSEKFGTFSEGFL
jgi:hypothetical protein